MSLNHSQRRNKDAHPNKEMVEAKEESKTA
jgi:hypothetical protein